MGPIDPEASLKIQPELALGEALLWTGRPNPSIHISSNELSRIPAGLVFVAIAVFGSVRVLGFGHTKLAFALGFLLYGLPFFMGNYMVWGHLAYDGWLKRRTYYGITNRRLIVVQETMKRKACSMRLDAIPSVEREGSFTGTLWFGTKYPLVPDRQRPKASWSRFSVRDAPVFVDIDDVDSAYRLILDLSEKPRGRQDEAIQQTTQR